MSRFYFHVRDARDIPDTEGTELPDGLQARIQAICLFGALLRDDPTGFYLNQGWRVEVADEAGSVIFAVSTSMIDAPPSRPLASERGSVSV